MSMRSRRIFLCRAILFFIGMSLCVSGARGQAISPQQRNSLEQSCRDFVQEFYDWCVNRDMLNEKSHKYRMTSDEVLRLRPQAFGVKLRRMLREDSAAQARAKELVGLDFDPFFNSQDPSSTFKVQAVTVRNGHCNAIVNGVEQGAVREHVEPELILQNGKWIFINFHYGSESSKDDNLLDTLKVLGEDRRKN